MGKVIEKYKENKKKGEFLQVQCVECKRNTRHQIVQSLEHFGSEIFDRGQYSIDWSDTYQIIQCQGCMSVTFRTESWFSENDGIREILYPKRTTHTLPIKDFLNIPSNLRRIYRETLESFNNEIFTLCAAGLRALVEGLCAALKVKGGVKEITKRSGVKEIKRFTNLEGKIAGLHEKGYLTKQHSDILHEHRYLGNEAVHELFQPSRDELALAIEIIEHIFESVYEIPQKAQDLQSKRAKRKKKK